MENTSFIWEMRKAWVYEYTRLWQKVYLGSLWVESLEGRLKNPSQR